MNDPTPRQREVLEFIHAFTDERGFPPTQAEIAEALGLRSPNAVSQHLRLLAKKGWLRVEAGRARGLRLLRTPTPETPGALSRTPSETDLPLVGEVAAGRPILAEEHVERRVAVSPRLFRPRADYLLRVRGDSMIDAGIRPGDLVAVHREGRAPEGAVAVVRLEDEVTVKRVRTHDGKLILEPANPRHLPVTVDPDRTQVAIEGLVVGLLRLEPEERAS